jgi:hypothetical protein
MAETKKINEKKVETKKTEKTDSKMKAPNRSVQSSPKDDAKMKELKIELLKQGSKKRDIKREIARMLTLQQSKIGDAKK